MEVEAIHFEPCECVEYGGVLFLLPFLLANHLLSYQSIYAERGYGYYNFDIAMLTVAFMYLCRIKNIEQFKHTSPGEFGKLMGLDRIPVDRTLRILMKEISDQKKAAMWNAYLADEWIKEEETNIFYVDGHVEVYSGYLANLPKKFVSRQKLCLPGITEFWVNNIDGLPYFYVTGKVNEKLQEVLEKEIVPQLVKLTANTTDQAALDADPLLPLFTIVFDREAYSLTFFLRLWDKFRVAVITYNKNVKDKWDEQEFTPYTIETDIKTTMQLCEKTIETPNGKIREIRRLLEDGHQTSVLTTNLKISTQQVAIYMFARWSQENFFRYMRQEFDIDKIFQYGVNELSKDIMVVNREYSKLTDKLKHIREKISRRKARCFELKVENINSDLDETGKVFQKLIVLEKEIEELKKEEEKNIALRKQQPYKIPIGQMPEETRYNALKTESKHLQNIIKIICYRAETALANLLAIHYKKAINEIRALVKSIIYARADIIPDYKINTLTITLYSLATPRDNEAIAAICESLNDTETIYSGTDLRMIFKSATICPASNQDS
jgi:prepilin-type processing-associated H-X9-DG protein